MEKITVRPGRLRNFGDSQNSVFCVVTEPAYSGMFEIESDPKYSDALIVEYDGKVEFATVLQNQIPDNCHVLVILPSFYFKSPPPQALGPRRKLGVMACFSTPTSPEAIRHFLQMAEGTDPQEQDRRAQDFFTRGERADALRFVDRVHGTSAVFEHLPDNLSWHEQIGMLHWGEQQLLPSGEISVLPVQVFGQNIDMQLSFNGTLALKGTPVLHAGSPSFLPRDQARIFDELAALEDHPLIATLENGVIVRLEATDPACRPAERMLSAMFAVDSRYRTLLEIGFGINTALKLFPGNAAMNEVYGASNGAVHFGLGLIPYTVYHLDLICPETSVESTAGEPILGPERTESHRGQPVDYARA